MTDEFPEKAKRAARAYHRDFAVAGALYVALIMGAVYLIKHFALPSWLVVVLAIAPFLPALMMLRAYVVHIGAMDEFQQRLHMRAVVIAACVVAFGSFAYGLLQDLAGFPPVSLIWVLPALSFVWGGVHLILRRRYK